MGLLNGDGNPWSKIIIERENTEWLADVSISLIYNYHLNINSVNSRYVNVFGTTISNHNLAE